LSDGLGVDALSEDDEIAISVEYAKLARAPRPVLQRSVGVNHTLSIEFGEQFVDSDHVHATTRVLGNMWLGAEPEVNLDVIPRHDTPNAGFDVTWVKPRREQ